MDWYRLKSEDEAVQAGMEDCLLDKNSYAIVEWPEQAPGLLPRPHLHMYIEISGHEDRVLKVLLINK
jgi:tRNA threonylcarbamoyladenosine biosynthesis protein TsaE